VKGLDGTSWRCEEDRPPQCQAGAAGTAELVLLAPSSIGLPPDLIDRLRAAGRELGLPESLIATVAIAVFLEGEGF
jgi:hypothetical protein